MDHIDSDDDMMMTWMTSNLFDYLSGKQCYRGSCYGYGYKVVSVGNSLFNGIKKLYDYYYN